MKIRRRISTRVRHEGRERSRVAEQRPGKELHTTGNDRPSGHTLLDDSIRGCTLAGWCGKSLVIINRPTATATTTVLGCVESTVK
jgi:hypothetical protein